MSAIADPLTFEVSIHQGGPYTLTEALLAMESCSATEFSKLTLHSRPRRRESTPHSLEARFPMESVDPKVLTNDSC